MAPPAPPKRLNWPRDGRGWPRLAGAWPEPGQPEAYSGAARLLRDSRRRASWPRSYSGLSSLASDAGDGRQVLLNEQAGHLLRAKLAEVDEGGVCAGFAVLSSPVLFP